MDKAKAQEVLTKIDEILRWEEEHGEGQIGVFVHLHVAGVLTHRGSVVDAAAHVDALLPRARESGDPQVLVPGLSAAALLASARGSVEESLECVSALEGMTRGQRVWRSTCLVWPLRIAVAAGKIELAEMFLDGSENRAAWDGCARPAARATLAEARGAMSDAAALYREAACLVFPSLYEGFGLPPLEAMASGCPVAAARAGAIPEICGDAAVLFDASDAESIAAGVLESVARADELRGRGIARAAEFTWEETARRHETVYSAAVSEGPAGSPRTP